MDNPTLIAKEKVVPPLVVDRDEELNKCLKDNGGLLAHLHGDALMHNIC
jgi:hypothetical protein